MRRTNNFNVIAPAHENYRDETVPIDEAFNFDEAVGDTDPSGIHVVEFISALNEHTLVNAPEKIIHLFDLDDCAKQDAETREGFMHYYPDTVSADGLARSFCAWTSQEWAQAAGQWPAHQAAVEYTRTEGRDVYKYYKVRQYVMHRTVDGLEFEQLSSVAFGSGNTHEHGPELEQKAA